MVDIYHLFKLGTTAGKLLKAAGGAYSVKVIFSKCSGELLGMGISGMVDAAFDELLDKVFEGAENGDSRRD